MTRRITRLVLLLIGSLTFILLGLSVWVQEPSSPGEWLTLLGSTITGAIGTLAGFKDVYELVQMGRGKNDEESSSSTHIDTNIGLAVTNSNVLIITADVAQAFWQQYPARRLSQPVADLQQSTEEYLNYLRDRYRFLQFKGMGVADRIPLNLPLIEMYVPLRARIEMPEGETWHRPLQVAGRPLSLEETEAVGPHLGKPALVLELLKQHDGLIILGDPGAGKTTFLKYLALRLTRGEGETLGIGPRLPLLLSLSAYANALAEADISLLDFIPHYYRQQNIDLPLRPLLEEALEQGGLLLLLDGLDEVKALTSRHLVIDRVISFFAFYRSKGNKFILTSRIVGYKEVRPSHPGLTECTLVDFEETEIEQFVSQWTSALERAAQGGQTSVAALDAAQERQELLTAIHNNPGVRQLAANPLLLTILALMKRQGVTLPERRVELYEQYIKTLIKHWNLARSLDRRHTHDLDIVETVRVLAPLALWMHQTSPGVGLVKKADMVRHLITIYQERQHDNPEKAAETLLQDARDHAGLLLERGQGLYGFIHLTFQEYLAAVAIAQQGQRGWQPIVKLLAEHITDDNWHEVILLTIGYIGLVLQWDEAAGDVLSQLLQQQPGQPGLATVLAGEAVLDTYPSGVTLACQKAVIKALHQTMRDSGNIATRQRVEAGRILARLGDPRPALTTLDDMAFCLIPPGPFWLGSDSVPQDDDAFWQEIYDMEKPCHKVTIPYPYWVGRYPVTNAQFEAFVTAGGYQKAAYWPEAQAAGLWQAGQVTMYTWLPAKGEHEKMTREQPYDYGHPFNLPSYPVVGVSWYEALAFCRWLTEQWQDKLPPGWQVQLPSEVEWEKAARGGVEVIRQAVINKVQEINTSLQPDLQLNPLPQRPYPWGDNLSEQANYYETQIAATNNVGCFVAGTSPYGCEEMSGNVFEWTRSLWGEWDSKQGQFKFKFTYPYEHDPDQERLDKDPMWTRTVKGGAWSANKTWLRCAVRYGDVPNNVNWVNGFRCVVSPFFTADR